MQNGKITTPYLNPKKILNSALLNSENIQRIVDAINEVADFVENLGIDGSEQFVNSLRALADVIGYLDGAVDRISKQPLLTSIDKLVKILKKDKSALQLFAGIKVGDNTVGDFLALVDPLLDTLDGIGADAEKSLIGAVLSRLGQLHSLIDLALSIDAIRNIEVMGYKIGDFEDVVDILFQILDENFYRDYQENPIKAIFDRIDYIKALYEWLREFGIKELLGDKVVFFGYNVIDAVDILLPVLDKQLYYDFEQSLWKAVTSSDRIGRLETALKSIIRFI